MMIIATALTVMASCTKEETVSVRQDDAINFRTSVGVASRAVSKQTFSVGDQFNVWASYNNDGSVSRYFQEDFKFDGNSWNSVTTPYYWPSQVDGTHSLTFQAVWPADISRNAAETFSYTVVDAAADQEDVLYAKHVSTSKETTGVKLNFRHTLSQIVVQARNSSSTLKCEVSGIKVAYLDKSGQFTATSAADGNTDDNNSGNLARTDWSATGAVANAASAYVQTGLSKVVGTEAEAAQLGTSWILMPQQQNIASGYTSTDEAAPMNGAYLAVKMAIRNAADNTVVASERWCCWPIAVNWTPGYKYTYTIDLAGGGYEEGNDDTDGDDDTELDPVLDNQEIFFVDCTIDAWDASDHNVTL